MTYGFKYPGKRSPMMIVSTIDEDSSSPILRIREIDFYEKKNYISFNKSNGKPVNQYY